MQGLSPPPAKSPSSVFHIPIGSPTNAAASTNVSTPKSTHRPHAFKKIQLISPSTPISSPNTEKLGKLFKSEKFMPKKEPFQVGSPKISIFDSGILSKKSSLPITQKSAVLEPSLDNLETKTARKFLLDTDRKKNKCSGSQSSIQEIITMEGNSTKPRKPSVTPKNKGNSIGSGRMLTDTEKMKPSPSIGDFLKSLTARDTLQTNKPRIQFLNPKEGEKKFDFSRPKAKNQLNYHLKGLVANPNTLGLKNHVPISSRSHLNSDHIHSAMVGGTNNSATLVTEINASGNSLINTTLKPLSVSHNIEKIEESVTLNVPTPGPTDNDASRTSNVRKPSNILSKELEAKYGIKLDYSNSSVTSEEDEEESEEIKDDINQLGSQHLASDKKLHRIFKEGSFARNRGGYLVQNHERSSSREDANQEDIKESLPKKKEQIDVFSAQSKDFFHFNESHLNFKDFTSLYKGIGPMKTNQKDPKKPWRKTSKMMPEDYKPMMARSHGGSQFVQPAYMKNMGSMCYTELWPKHFSLKMQKILLKEENEKSNEIAKSLGNSIKKEGVPKPQVRKEELQKSFQRKFRGTLQSWGNGPLPTESSGLLTTKRKSDGNISARSKH